MAYSASNNDSSSKFRYLDSLTAATRGISHELVNVECESRDNKNDNKNRRIRVEVEEKNTKYNEIKKCRM